MTYRCTYREKRAWGASAALCVLCLAAGMVLSFANTAHAFEAGAAKVEITPPVGTPLNGYGARLGRDSLSVHDPLWARCLYLNDGETDLYLVTMDLCIVNPELRARILELAGVPPERVVLTATHTHSAQGAMISALPFRAVSGRFIPEVLEVTARGVAEAMRNAQANRKRAAIGFGTASGEGLSANRQVDDGPVDEQIGILRVEDPDGNPVVLLANFAAHPTTIDGADLFAISADYPGFFYTAIEELAGANTVAMFMNGAEGNQRCGNPENKSGWERTQSIGTLLAQRVFEASGAILCGEAKLHTGYATPALPKTLVSGLFPQQTVIQTVEMAWTPPVPEEGQKTDAAAPQRLLMTFFPGETCVELALEMRTRALAAGYTGQFTAGLANDYLGYFVPPELYSSTTYEAGMSFYGPRIADWLYREFEALMTREVPREEPPAPGAASLDEIAGGQWLTVQGAPYTLGFQQGEARKAALQQAYENAVVKPFDAGLPIAAPGWMQPVLNLLNMKTLGIPALAMGQRPRLAGLPLPVVEELAGMADGAALPFDAVWLQECAPFAGMEGVPLPWTPSGTMMAATGERAGADDLLVAHNLDWDGPEAPVVVDFRPAEGFRVLYIGGSTTSGTFCGMNDAGLVLCAIRVGPPPEFKPESLDLTALFDDDDEEKPVAAPPAPGLLLSGILRQAEGINGAYSLLQASPGLRGYHVLLASPKGDGGRSRACIVEMTGTAMVRNSEEGFLLGAAPDTPRVDEAVAARHLRAQELLGEERIVAPVEMRNALQDPQIQNGQTRCSVVFEPKRGRMRVAFPTEDGQPGAFTAITFSSGREGGS